MTSRNKLLFPALVLCLMGLPMKAQIIPSGTTLVTCKASELPQHPFQSGGLTLNITRFVGDAAILNRTISFQLMNPTSGFVSFPLSDLAVVGNGGHQALLSGWLEGGNSQKEFHIPPASIRVAPGATLNLNYFLEQSVKPPVKLYLGDKQIAEITD